MTEEGFTDDEAPSALLLEEVAARIEHEMTEMAEHWEHVAEAERAAVLARLERSAPQVVRLLCPVYGRFRPH